MAIPAFVAASTGSTDATGAWTHTCAAPAQAGNVIIIQVLVDGTTAGAPTISSITNAENLAGTDNVVTTIGTFNVGSATAGTQQLYICRSLSTSAPVVTGTNTGGDDVYVRAYEFSGVNTGTTLVEIIENAIIPATQPTSSSFRLGELSTNQQLAQTFTATGDFAPYVDIELSKTGSPSDNLTCEIQAVTGLVPNGTVLATSSVVSGSTLTTTQTFTRFTFSAALTLTPATSYAVVLKRSGAVSGTNYYNWGGIASDTYAGGDYCQYNGATWTESSNELSLKIPQAAGVNGVATSVTVADTGVTTFDTDRLALNFTAITDDATGLALFTGATGGTWANFQLFESASGTDGTVAMVTADMATAGRIDGGTDTIVSLPWGTVGFALIPPAAGPAALMPRHGFVNFNDPGVC